MQSSTFRYYHLKISAKTLPGRGFRCDPLAVVFTECGGSWSEIGRTEKRLNEWNPKFSQSIALPADNDEQRRVKIRVDFYNREMVETRFLGTCEINFFALISANGQDVELELQTPETVSGRSRVYLAALEGYVAEPGNVSFSLQLAQTNYYGVSMKMFYEISRASNQNWYPVFKSDHILIDEQGWGQFPSTKISLQDLTMDEEGTGLLFSVYRFRRLGPKKLLGNFQTSIKDLNRTREGDFIPFSGNAKEDLLSANVQITHSQKVGTDYNFGLKLVNVIWRAPMLTPENIA